MILPLRVPPQTRRTPSYPPTAQLLASSQPPLSTRLSLPVLQRQTAAQPTPSTLFRTPQPLEQQPRRRALAGGFGNMWPGVCFWPGANVDVGMRVTTEQHEHGHVPAPGTSRPVHCKAGPRSGRLTCAFSKRDLDRLRPLAVPPCSAPTWARHGDRKRLFKRRPPFDRPDPAPRRAHAPIHRPPARRRLPTHNAVRCPPSTLSLPSAFELNAATAHFMHLEPVCDVSIKIIERDNSRQRSEASQLSYVQL